MVAEADETLMETFFAEGTLTQEQLVSGCAPRPSRAGSSRWSARRDCTSSAFSRCSTPWWPTSHRRPSATSRCWQGRRRDVGQGERQRALHGVCVEDDRRSVRRAHHDAARRVGGAEVGHDGAQLHARLRRTARPPDRPPGQDPHARARVEGGRPRSRRQAEGDQDERRAGREVRRRSSQKSSFPSRCSPTRSSRRAAATRTRSARQCSGCGRKIPRSATPATRRPTNCCWPGRDSSTSRSRSPS